MYEQQQLKDTVRAWIRQFGTKAAAQKLFRLLHLFPHPLWVFPPRTDFRALEESVLGEEELVRRGLTVRFSRSPNLSLGDQINAPRLFSSSFEDIRSFIGDHWNTGIDKSSSIVIYPAIDLTYSYELYLDPQKSILELFPGLWEVDEAEPVDRMYILPGNVVIERCTRRRQVAVYRGSTRDHVAVAPLTFEFLAERCARVIRLLPILRFAQECLGMSQTILHFIEDREQFFYFLNARHHRVDWDGMLPDRQDAQPAFHRVTDPKDIETWDGKLPVLFLMTSEREQSTRLMQCIDMLVGKVQEVYVEAGLLSHAAILLRERGFDVKQVIGDSEVRRFADAGFIADGLCPVTTEPDAPDDL